MKTQNKAYLIGYVGKDPAVFILPSGDKKVSLRIATNHTVVDPEGKKTYKATWHNVVAWGAKAELVVNSFSKGSHILVEGPIVYNAYPDKSGKMRYETVIYANHFLNLDR